MQGEILVKRLRGTEADQQKLLNECASAGFELKSVIFDAYEMAAYAYMQKPATGEIKPLEAPRAATPAPSKGKRH